MQVREPSHQLIIKRNVHDVLTLPAFLIFSKDDKNTILKNAAAIPFSVLSYSEAAQKKDLETITDKLTFKNSLLQTAFQDKKLKNHLCDLILYSKYLFDYQRDIKKHAFYITQFKKSIKTFYELVGEEHIGDYLKALAEENNFSRIIALAYHDIISQDILLEGFRSGELMGHDIAYRIAQAPNQYTQVIVNDQQDKFLESYSIKEIIANKENGDRDTALMGSILIPDALADEQPIIYINWTGTHNKGTLNADKERAPGEESYRRCEDQILKQVIESIDEVYAKHKKPVKLVFSGHSLGGALAQLCFHSCQRAIAQSFNDQSIQEKIASEEIAFKKGLDEAASLFKLSLHHRSLEKLTIQKEKISGLQIDNWNSPGVLIAVEKYSNSLSSIITKNSEITHIANVGIVSGDIVQTAGQGMILSEVGENGALVNAIKIYPEKMNMYSTLAAPVGGWLTGGALAPLVGLGTMTGGAGVALVVLVAVLKSKADVHRLHHFKETERPQQTYKMYRSHHPDGSLNEDPQTGYKKIRETIGRKSTVVDLLMNGISNLGHSSGLRLQSEKGYHDKRFQDALAKIKQDEHHEQHVFALLITEMKSDTHGADQRIIECIKKHKLINVKNTDGKTLFQQAISLGLFNLADKLLGIEGIDVDLLDKENNTAMLLFMQKINTTLSWNTDVYKFGLNLLEKTSQLDQSNHKGESVRSIFSAWKWNGVNSREFSQALSNKLSPKMQLTKK